MKEKLLKDLKSKEQSVKDLEHILSLLSWDQETGMPKAAGRDRARQMGLIQDIITGHLRDPHWEDWLEELSQDRAPENIQWYRLLKRRFDEYQKLPPDFMSRFVESSSLARDYWMEAREKNDFSLFSPSLKILVDLLKEKISCTGFEEEPYNALLDKYEPGMKADALDTLFSRLQFDLTPIFRNALDKQGSLDRVKDSIIPVKAQNAISMRVLKDMGYDFEAGRLDFSVHPFTITLGSRDVRITTSFRDNDFFSGLSSTIHEGGHGLYEQNFPPLWFGTMAAEACSYGFHESQSRLWENIIGRSRPFSIYLYRILEEEVPGAVSSADDLYRHMNRVGNSPIRVDADEVSYNLHIILRFRLERDLINGNLSVDDLPYYWNSESKGLLGLENLSDRSGILQDIHWSGGDMGYFPTYALGNLFSAQIWETLKKSLVNVNDHIERGDFFSILEWLKENIHSKGALVTSSDLVESITGTKLNASPFIRYLKEKQKDLYGT